MGIPEERKDWYDTHCWNCEGWLPWCFPTEGELCACEVNA